MSSRPEPEGPCQRDWRCDMSLECRPRPRALPGISTKIISKPSISGKQRPLMRPIFSCRSCFARWQLARVDLLTRSCLSYSQSYHLITKVNCEGDSKMRRLLCLNHSDNTVLYIVKLNLSIDVKNVIERQNLIKRKVISRTQFYINCRVVRTHQ